MREVLTSGGKAVLVGGKAVVADGSPPYTGEYTVIPKIFGEDARYALIAVNGTLTVRAGSGDGDSDKPYIPMPSSYIIKVYESENGAVYVSRSKAFEGDRVTVTVKAKDGYVLDTLTVTDTRGREIKLTEKVGEDGVYVFRMPASTVYVSASFANKILFNDVSPDAPYFDAVVWAHHGLFCSGPDYDTTFGLMHTIEKSADIYIRAMSCGLGIRQTISDDNLRAIARDFHIQLNEEFLD